MGFGEKRGWAAIGALPSREPGLSRKRKILAPPGIDAPNGGEKTRKTASYSGFGNAPGIR
jgi:hypothetical protein